MTEPHHFTTPEGRRIAYHYTPGQGPCVVFLGGFMSDMTGTKALYLQDWAQARERAFLRFDYSGHGASSGAFKDGCIGDWLADARAVIAAQTSGPVVLVGSSMGGWIALLLARAAPAQVAGLVGVAAAPDFTQDLTWAQYSPAQQHQLQTIGWIEEPSGYSDQPYLITMKLIEDGARHLVLQSPLELPFPLRLLQGTADIDVPAAVALRLLDHASGADIRLTLVKGADHRFSTPDCLAMIGAAVEDVIAANRKGP